MFISYIDVRAREESTFILTNYLSFSSFGRFLDKNKLYPGTPLYIVIFFDNECDQKVTKNRA